MTTRLCIGLLLGFVLAFCGCHPKHLPAPRFDPVIRDDYAYQRLNDGEFRIAAPNARGLELALQEIGCGRVYICQVEPIGHYFSVLQRKK